MKKLILASAIAMGLSMNANAGPLERDVAIDSQCAGVFLAASFIYEANGMDAKAKEHSSQSWSLKASAVTKAQYLGLKADHAIKSVNGYVKKSTQDTIQGAINQQKNGPEALQKYFDAMYARCETPMILAVSKYPF